MAGSINSIYNFCNSNPTSPGCPFSLAPAPVPKICDNFPFEIGTSVGCRAYNVYWLKDEYVEADVVIPDWTLASGTTYNLVAPLYAGVYADVVTPNPIGYFKLITTQFSYNSAPSTPLLNTDNYSFYWINGDSIVASIDAIYDYVGTGTNPFFEPGSTHQFKSTGAYQLLNKNPTVELYAGADDNVRQCKITVR